MKRCKVSVLFLIFTLFTTLIPFGTPTALAETDPSQNHVLQVLTGSPQWEGAIIHSDGSNSMNLEPKKTYEFAFRAYTPSKGVGLRFQANTFGGWDWDGIIDYAPEDFQPQGWYEISGSLTLNKPGTTDLPRMVLVKTQGDNEGLVAKLWIDDFTVTDAATGEVVFSEDFESGKTGAFRDNGGVCSVVSEQAIYDDAVTVTDGEYALDVPSLKEIYQDYFLIGNIINSSDFGAGAASKERYNILKHHYNAITYENEMKPDAMWGPSSVYDKPEQRDFTPLDEQIGRMTADGFHVIGHTLGWHGQSPNWLNLSAGSRNNSTAVYKPYAEARSNLEEYINLIAGRFYNRSDGAKIYSWDVLNEALRRDRAYAADEENWGRHALGHIWPANWVSPWYMSYGTDAPAEVDPWDYIYDIYTLARKADPSAILYYNDYGMEDPSQVQLVVNMVNVLNAQWAADTVNNPDAGSYAGENSEIVREYKKAGGRLLIEGIGMQEHDTINTNIKNVEAAIHAYAAAGCKVSITELDVGVPGYSRGQEMSAEDEEKQARYYAELFAMFKKNYEYIERVTFWGLDDAHSWRSNELCLLFNGDLRTKEAYYAVADPEGWLAENPLGQPSEPSQSGKTSEAKNATVTIPRGSDWTIGPEWDNAPVLSTDSLVEGSGMNAAKGEARVLWDEENVYVLIEVTDSALRKNAANKWEQDSVEVFLSETNASAGSYELGDGQYRVNYENTQSFGSQGAVEGFQSAARIVPDRGYDVIMAIPFTTVTPKSGTTIGLDVQVNDRNEEDTQRTSVMMWSDNTGNSYISNTNWGSLTLTEATDDTALEVTPTLSAQTPETSPQNTAETKPDSNHTVAVIIIILALAVAGIAVFIVLRRKKTGKK